MVKERSTLAPEVLDIFKHIDNGNNFLLSGGAGSGKTHSLVEVIKQVIVENPICKIACITYTNAAVKNIERRVDHKDLKVSTIHDFLWDSIKHFQKEIKASLVDIINESDSKIDFSEGIPIKGDYFESLENGIQYGENLRIKEGFISHDEVIIVADHLFKYFPKLSDLLKDKYQFIFVDEYQDTAKNVIEILLTHIKQSEKKNIVGFFGDSMQSIYDDGIGDLDEYQDCIKEVRKKVNYRNPLCVIDLANKLRTDGIQQVSPIDQTLSNKEKIKEKGSLIFYYSNESNLEKLKSRIGWDFDNKESKILNLTHNLIAPNAGFMNLMKIYDKDPVIGLKNDILEKIKDRKKHNKFYNISEDDTFDQVVDQFQLHSGKKNGPLKKTVIIENPTSKDLYYQLKDLPFYKVRKIFLDSEQLIDGKKQDVDEVDRKRVKRDGLLKHLFKIQNNISLYKNKEYNEFIRITDYRIRSIANKIELKRRIEELTDVDSKNIEEIINLAHVYGICVKDDKFIKFITENEYIFNRVKKVQFSEFQNLYNFLEGFTPFSTQHKTKGSEFDNVLVILDNGGWTKYNFKEFFEKTSIPTVDERTNKILYMCCTRAKSNLALFIEKPTQVIIEKAIELFGKDAVIDIDI